MNLYEQLANLEKSLMQQINGGFDMGLDRIYRNETDTELMVTAVSTMKSIVTVMENVLKNK